MARALPSILPPMSINEALDVTRVYSVADMLPSGMPLVRQRPFRAPHHTISNAGLVGGGHWPRPGEISLAHRAEDDGLGRSRAPRALCPKSPQRQGAPNLCQTDALLDARGRAMPRRRSGKCQCPLGISCRRKNEGCNRIIGKPGRTTQGLPLCYKAQ
jgi:hypothetical protein